MKMFDAKPVKQVDYDKQLKRLEKKQKIIDKVSERAFTAGVALEGLAMFSFIALPPLGRAQICAEFGGFVAGVALLGAGIAGGFRTACLDDKIVQLKRKVDPDKYYQDLIRREQQTLANYAKMATNPQDYSVEEVGRAVKSLPKQKETAEIFEKAYQVGKENGKLGRVQHLMNLYEDNDSNRDRSVALMKRIISENSERH